MSPKTKFLLLLGCSAFITASPSLADSGGSDRAAGRTAIDGIYRLQTTAEELRVLAPSDVNVSNYGKFTVVFAQGHFVITQRNNSACTWQYGTFRLKANRLTLSFVDGGGIGTTAYNKPGERFAFGVRLAGTALTLSGIAGAVSPAPLRVKPLSLVSKAPRWVWSADRCAPPRKALPH